jgi:hypothetical protein
VKLAPLFCIALLSVGCATDEDSNNGGFSAVRPVKSSEDLPYTQNGDVPDVSKNGLQKVGMYQQDSLLHGSDAFAESIKDGHAPLPNEVCGGCEVTLITVHADKADNGAIGEIDVVNDGGEHICTIINSADGTQDASDCVR